MKHRQILAVAAVAGTFLAACGSNGQGNVTVGQSPNGQDVAVQAETRSTAPEAPQGPTTDLAGSDATVAIDHAGQYEWTSSVVLPYQPDQYNWSETTAGGAKVSGFETRLVEAAGGYSLQITFNVDSFEGSPSITFVSRASGPGTPIVPKESK